MTNSPGNYVSSFRWTLWCSKLNFLSHTDETRVCGCNFDIRRKIWMWSNFKLVITVLRPDFRPIEYKLSCWGRLWPYHLLSKSIRRRCVLRNPCKKVIFDFCHLVTNLFLRISCKKVRFDFWQSYLPQLLNNFLKQSARKVSQTLPSPKNEKFWGQFCGFQYSF